MGTACRKTALRGASAHAGVLLGAQQRTAAKGTPKQGEQDHKVAGAVLGRNTGQETGFYGDQRGAGRDY